MRLLCALVALLLVPSQPDLLARAAHASGEPWRYHVVSHLAGTQTQIDEQGSVVVSRRCRGAVCTGIMFDTAGARVSVLSYNDTPIRQSAPLDADAVTLRAIESYAFASSDFARAGGSVVALPARRLGTAEVAPFAVTAPGGARLDALLDPRTGLLVGVARELHVIYRYEAQRQVGSLTLPFVIRGGDGSVQAFSDRHIAADPLAEPTGPAVSFEQPAAPARLEGGVLPRFPCRIEGIAARCVLDTGAEGVAISLDVADRLGKSFIGQVDLEGLGRVSTGVVRVKELDLGSMRFGPALFAVIPDALGLGADVVVGSDVLARAVVRVDPSRHTIAFEPPGAALTGTIVPLTFAGATPRVPIRLDAASADAVLDTGDAASIDLDAAFARDHAGLMRAGVRHGVVGVGGREIETTATIDDVAFAGSSLRNVPASISAIASPGTPRIGAAFLSRFAVDVDYTEGRMSVRLVR